MYDALGLQFTVSSTDATTRDRVARLLSGLLAPVPAATEAITELVVEGRTLECPDPMGTLVGVINLRSVEAARGCLLLHAGAVAIPQTGAIVLSGPSGSGKSTLTAALASRYAYVTDEIVCLDPYTMRVTPFRKPLALKQGAQHLFPHLAPRSVAGGFAEKRWLVPADDLGRPPLPDQPLIPNIVVFPTHAPGADIEVARLAEDESAYRLGSNATQLSAVRGGGVDALARLARRAPAYELTYGDLESAVALVESLASEAA